MSEPSDVQLLVSRVPLLAKLHKVELESLVQHLVPKSYRVNQTVLKEGAPEVDMLFLAEGQVKVCRADNTGKEVILALLGSGGVVGEIALLTGVPRSADVIATLPCKALLISQADFFTHVRKFSGLSLELLKMMALRVQMSSQRIMDLALYDVCCRVARVLLSLSQNGIRNEEAVSVVNPRPTHQTLASMVGSSREVVSRALKTLEDESHIAIDDDCVYVYSLP